MFLGQLEAANHPFFPLATSEIDVPAVGVFLPLKSKRLELLSNDLVGNVVEETAYLARR